MFFSTARSLVLIDGMPVCFGGKSVFGALLHRSQAIGWGLQSPARRPAKKLKRQYVSYYLNLSIWVGMIAGMTVSGLIWWTRHP
jgi:hypothetical protein